jgi:ABC-type glycerol-3-phosphate transport system permease component
LILIWSFLQLLPFVWFIAKSLKFKSWSKRKPQWYWPQL